MGKRVLTYLDCGCAIYEDGTRCLCPSCLKPPKPNDDVHPSGGPLRFNNEDGARTFQFNRRPTAPYAWIQWKGTSVCMDVYCPCGDQFHVDADFAYTVQCPYCRRMFSCDGHIRLYEIKMV